MNISIPYPLKFLNLNVYNFCPGLNKLSVQSYKCIFLEFTRSQKGYKCFSPSLNSYFISTDFIFTKYSFYLNSLSSPHVFPSDQVHISVVFYSHVISIVLEDFFPPPPLQVYNGHQTSHRPLGDSLLVTPPPSTLTVEPDILNVIHKGIRSTYNPSPHYTVLSYHRLSQSFLYLPFDYFFYVHSKICR